MSDIDYWYDEYKKEVDQFRILIDRLKALVESSNIKAVEGSIKDCDLKAMRAREVKKSFGLELRLVRDKALRADYEIKMKELDSTLNDLSRALNKIKADNSKSTLFGETTNPTFEYSTEGKDNEALLGEAHHVQDLTFESLARTRNMIQASKEVGAATVETLKNQKEQIIDIEQVVDEMDSNLVRAEKLVFNFTRRMATDRIIQLFAVVNIVVLLGLILYVAGSGKSLSSIGKSSGGGSSSSGTQTPTMTPTVAPSFAPSLAPNGHTFAFTQQQYLDNFSSTSQTTFATPSASSVTGWVQWSRSSSSSSSVRLRGSFV